MTDDDSSGRRMVLWKYQKEAGACAVCHDEDLLYREPGKRAYPLFQSGPSGGARVLFVAEAPNFEDSFDEQKRRLTYDVDTDPTGVFARRLIASAGLALEDVLFTNSVLCLPARKKGKHPVSARQTELCRPWLARLIDLADPLVVVTFGARALYALNRLERHGLELKNAVGKLHPWRGRELLPLYHPGLLGRVTRTETQQIQDIAVLKRHLAACYGLDLSIVKEVMDATVEGARLQLRGPEGEFSDIAFTIGFQVSPAKFAYLSPTHGPPFDTNTRFYVEGLQRLASDGWLIRCRHEDRTSEIEVRPIENASQKAMLKAWLDKQPEDVLEHMESTMKFMLDPKSL